MVDTLRTYCPGFDATVYISTRIEDGIYQDYEATMIWPFKQMERRQFNGIYLGLEFQFRHLKVVDYEMDESEAVTVGEAATVLLANYPLSVSDSVTVGESVTVKLLSITASEAVSVGESVGVSIS